MLRGRRPTSERLAAPKLFRAFADATPRAFFIEIGSNDGDQHDHLRPFILQREWSGVMVEPVPYVFERLRANYGHLERVSLENAAVGPAEGEIPFYYLVEATEEERDALPSWYDGVGSFRRDVVLRHADDIPHLTARVVSENVPTLTFDSLCRRHGVGRIDLLLIDTEGYDWEIIQAIDLRRYAPVLLVYEHFHLSPEARRACALHLRRHGYRIMEEGFDTFCLGPGAARKLRWAWRRLRPAVRGVNVHDAEL